MQDIEVFLFFLIPFFDFQGLIWLQLTNLPQRIKASGGSRFFFFFFFPDQSGEGRAQRQLWPVFVSSCANLKRCYLSLFGATGSANPGRVFLHQEKRVQNWGKAAVSERHARPRGF